MDSTVASTVVVARKKHEKKNGGRGKKKGKKYKVQNIVEGRKVQSYPFKGRGTFVGLFVVSNVQKMYK